MNNKSFHVQEFSGDINNGTDADNLVLILKHSGGVMIAEAINPDGDGSGRETCPESGLKTDCKLGNLKIL